MVSILAFVILRPLFWKKKVVNVLFMGMTQLKIHRVRVVFLSQVADQVKGYAKMLQKESKWTKVLALALPVKLNGNNIIAIVDMVVLGWWF